MGYIKALRSTFHSQLLRHTQTAPHLITGQKGESLARRYLRRIGYTILGENIRLKHDEIDFLAFDPADETLVFAEVRTRSTFDDDFGPNLYATRWKKRKLQRSARRWVANHEFEGGYRIDVICIARGRIVEHVKEIAWE